MDKIGQCMFSLFAMVVLPNENRHHGRAIVGRWDKAFMDVASRGTIIGDDRVFG